ncbi:hypothetical protein LCGC14_1032460 [marine sediment metagenome]|uniref:Fibronectin type-III domain-containing protein n=1 Tax=marine sediment metagenome TaxID=412755 RepID=A0A0F9QCB5_9ZZZZ
MALQEFYTASSGNNSITSSTFWVAMTYTTVSAYDITGVNLGFSRLGPFVGNVTVSIRATDENDKPTDGDLASFTFDGSTLTTSNSGEWTTRNFDSPYSLSSGVIYAIVIRHDGSSHLRYRRQSNGAYGGGGLHTSSNSGGTWGDISTSDVKFAVYGDVALPGKPTTPSPTDAVSDITLDETPLSWVSGGNTDTYNVYFRLQGEDWVEVSSAQAALEWAIVFGTLGYEATYEWRVDATNIAGTTTGDTWSFDSLVFDQLRVSYVLISGGSGAGPYDDPAGTEGTDWRWTGINFMTAIRRLVVAANSKIWYESI